MTFSMETVKKGQVEMVIKTVMQLLATADALILRQLPSLAYCRPFYTISVWNYFTSISSFDFQQYSETQTRKWRRSISEGFLLAWLG